MEYVDAPMAMLDQPRRGTTWRHFRNKKVYTVKGFALFCDTDHEERLLVIYEDAEGGSFARSQHEWHNTIPGGGRRFTEVVPAAVVE